MVALVAMLYSVVMLAFHIHFFFHPSYWEERFSEEIYTQDMDAEQFSHWLTTRFVFWPAYLRDLCGH